MVLSSIDQEDKLERDCKEEIEALHGLFVDWFQGRRPRLEIQEKLIERLQYTFSHVGPNGLMVSGRTSLLSQLQDKYACYKDKVFSIDVYRVSMLWKDQTKCLCTYEEWQSWEREVSSNGGARKKEVAQFGRLSTCLLEIKMEAEKKRPDSPNFTWIQVHETWLQEKAPSAVKGKDGEGVVDSSKQKMEQIKQQERQAAAASLAPGPTPTPAPKAAAAAPPVPDDDSVEYAENPDAPRLIVLLSKTGLSGAEAAVQAESKGIIDGLQIPHDEIDGSDPLQRGVRNILFDISGAFGKYPQFFTKQGEVIRFWGEWQRFKDSYEAGRLKKELGMLIPADQVVHKAPVKPKHDSGGGDVYGAGEAIDLNYDAVEAGEFNPEDENDEDGTSEEDSEEEGSSEEGDSEEESGSEEESDEEPEETEMASHTEATDLREDQRMMRNLAAQQAKSPVPRAAAPYAQPPSRATAASSVARSTSTRSGKTGLGELPPPIANIIPPNFVSATNAARGASFADPNARLPSGFAAASAEQDRSGKTNIGQLPPPTASVVPPMFISASEAGTRSGRTNIGHVPPSVTMIVPPNFIAASDATPAQLMAQNARKPNGYHGTGVSSHDNAMNTLAGMLPAGFMAASQAAVAPQTARSGKTNIGQLPPPTATVMPPMFISASEAGIRSGKTNIGHVPSSVKIVPPNFIAASAATPEQLRAQEARGRPNGFHGTGGSSEDAHNTAMNTLAGLLPAGFMSASQAGAEPAARSGKTNIGQLPPPTASVVPPMFISASEAGTRSGKTNIGHVPPSARNIVPPMFIAASEATPAQLMAQQARKPNGFHGTGVSSHVNAMNTLAGMLPAGFMAASQAGVAPNTARSGKTNIGQLPPPTAAVMPPMFISASEAGVRSGKTNIGHVPPSFKIVPPNFIAASAATPAQLREQEARGKPNGFHGTGGSSEDAHNTAMNTLAGLLPAGFMAASQTGAPHTERSGQTGIGQLPPPISTVVPPMFISASEAGTRSGKTNIGHVPASITTIVPPNFISASAATPAQRQAQESRQPNGFHGTGVSSSGGDSSSVGFVQNLIGARTQGKAKAAALVESDSEEESESESESEEESSEEESESSVDSYVDLSTISRPKPVVKKATPKSSMQSRDRSGKTGIGELPPPIYKVSAPNFISASDANEPGYQYFPEQQTLASVRSAAPAAPKPVVDRSGKTGIGELPPPIYKVSAPNFISASDANEPGYQYFPGQTIMNRMAKIAPASKPVDRSGKTGIGELPPPIYEVSAPNFISASDANEPGYQYFPEQTIMNRMAKAQPAMPTSKPMDRSGKTGVGELPPPIYKVSAPNFISASDANEPGYQYFPEQTIMNRMAKAQPAVPVSKPVDRSGKTGIGELPPPIYKVSAPNFIAASDANEEGYQYFPEQTIMNRMAQAQPAMHESSPQPADSDSEESASEESDESEESESSIDSYVDLNTLNKPKPAKAVAARPSQQESGYQYFPEQQPRTTVRTSAPMDRSGKTGIGELPPPIYKVSAPNFISASDANEPGYQYFPEQTIMNRMAGTQPAAPTANPVDRSGKTGIGELPPPIYKVSAPNFISASDANEPGYQYFPEQTIMNRVAKAQPAAPVSQAADRSGKTGIGELPPPIYKVSAPNFISASDAGEPGYQYFPERTIMNRMAKAQPAVPVSKPVDRSGKTGIGEMPPPIYKVSAPNFISASQANEPGYQYFPEQTILSRMAKSAPQTFDSESASEESESEESESSIDSYVDLTTIKQPRAVKKAPTTSSQSKATSASDVNEPGYQYFPEAERSVSSAPNAVDRSGKTGIGELPPPIYKVSAPNFISASDANEPGYQYFPEQAIMNRMANAQPAMPTSKPVDRSGKTGIGELPPPIYKVSAPNFISASDADEPGYQYFPEQTIMNRMAKPSVPVSKPVDRSGKTGNGEMPPPIYKVSAPNFISASQANEPGYQYFPEEQAMSHLAKKLPAGFAAAAGNASAQPAAARSGQTGIGELPPPIYKVAAPNFISASDANQAGYQYFPEERAMSRIVKPAPSSASQSVADVRSGKTNIGHVPPSVTKIAPPNFISASAATPAQLRAQEARQPNGFHGTGASHSNAMNTLAGMLPAGFMAASEASEPQSQRSGQTNIGHLPPPISTVVPPMFISASEAGARSGKTNIGHVPASISNIVPPNFISASAATPAQRQAQEARKPNGFHGTGTAEPSGDSSSVGFVQNLIGARTQGKANAAAAAAVVESDSEEESDESESETESEEDSSIDSYVDLTPAPRKPVKAKAPAASGRSGKTNVGHMPPPMSTIVPPMFMSASQSADRSGKTGIGEMPPPIYKVSAPNFISASEANEPGYQYFPEAQSMNRISRPASSEASRSGKTNIGQVPPSATRIVPPSFMSASESRSGKTNIGHIPAAVPPSLIVPPMFMAASQSSSGGKVQVFC